MQQTTMRLGHVSDVRVLCPRRPRPCMPAKLRAVTGGERSLSPIAPGSADSSTSACPYAHVAKEEGSLADSPAYIPSSSIKQASTWRVLKPGEGEGLPRPSGRFCWMPLVGDALEVDKGAGQFYLERYRWAAIASNKY